MTTYTQKGEQIHDVKGGERITVAANGSFIIWFVKADGTEYIAGPNSVHDRRFKWRMPAKLVAFKVIPTAKDTITTVEIGHKAEGKEVPDPLPLAVHEPKPLTLQEEIARMVGYHLSMRDDGPESFEEADDFDFDDDSDILSPYEFHDMQDEEPVEPEQARSEQSEREPVPPPDDKATEQKSSQPDSPAA